jgi:hypothetical protein
LEVVPDWIGGKALERFFMDPKQAELVRPSDARVAPFVLLAGLHCFERRLPQFKSAFDEHASHEKRVNEIFLRNARTRSAVGCPKMVEGLACEHTPENASSRAALPNEAVK